MAERLHLLVAQNFSISDESDSWVRIRLGLVLVNNFSLFSDVFILVSCHMVDKDEKMVE